MKDLAKNILFLCVIGGGLGVFLGSFLGNKVSYAPEVHASTERLALEISADLSDVGYPSTMRNAVLIYLNNHGYRLIDKNSDEDIKFARAVAKGLVGSGSESTMSIVKSINENMEKRGYQIVKK